MRTHFDDAQLVLKTAAQLASGLIQAIVTAHGLSQTQANQLRHDRSMIHFHDNSTNGIAWNDVMAILMYNEATGENIPVPQVASEGYNQHGHTSPFDGGWIPGMGIHDHRDNVTGCGFAFACYHPGTALPQQPWAI
jgi:hypothetical protein